MEKLDFLKYQSALSKLAFDPAKSLGRRFKDDEELLLYGNAYDPFQLDIDKIRLGKFYRRLNDKTQVFPPEKHANIRNRQVHTGEVVSLSSFAASILGLNQNLCEAIAYGHDIGHTPYGHLGEMVISRLSDRYFSHAVMSVVVAQKIERAGKGLNLSYETLEGMLNHSRGSSLTTPSNGVSQEATLVMVADKIAYTFADLNDALKIGCLTRDKTPNELMVKFGVNQRESIATVVYALIKESAEKGKISFLSSDIAQNFFELRKWMYQNLYYKLNEDEDRDKKARRLKEIFEIFKVTPLFAKTCPYFLLAILTDGEAKRLAQKSSGFSLMDLGFLEIVYRLIDNGCSEIDIFDADLHKKDFCF